MADVQKEYGNTEIANAILEALARTRIPGEAGQVVYFLFRKIYGWHKTADQLSLSQFSEATGLTKVHVCRAINTLLGMNIITQEGKGVLKTYRFQKDYDQWIPLPKRVKLPKRVIPVTQEGKESLPKRVNYKRNYTKENSTKEIYVTFFEIFWKDAPARDGKKLHKLAAFNEYCRLREDELETVNLAVLNYANSKSIQEGIGICDPVRFLIRGKGKDKEQPWKDWITPASNEAPGKDWA